jgi:hypothetical protein
MDRTGSSGLILLLRYLSEVEEVSVAVQHEIRLLVHFRCVIRLHSLGHENSFLFRFFPRITHSLTRGAEPFLRSRQLCSYSRTYQHFMELAGSLPCSQEHWSLSWARSTQSIPSHPIYLRSILKLSTHLRLGLFPSGIPTNILCAFIFSPIRVTYLAHLILIDFIILIILGEDYKLW